LFYNKTAFKAAGLNPANPPTTFSEVEQMAKKLTKKDSSGKVTQYGFSMAIYGWYFEQLLVKQGMEYANNGNGRKGKATEVIFDKNGAGLKVMKEWKKLVDSGYVGNYGRNTGDTQNAFVAGNTAMFINSTASLGAVLKSVGGKFEVGTAFLPKLNSTDKGGVSIGGASLWIMDKKDIAKQNSAWEFIKFMVSPDQQAYWNKNTGYFPVTKKAYDTQTAKDNFKQYPQFWTAVYQLHSSTAESRGALLGVFPEARAAIETNIEDMISNKQTPEEAVNNAAKVINAAIARYNETNK
jgi:sn-glycerol 3-phosphate transport system substrate-binding protein